MSEAASKRRLSSLYATVTFDGDLPFAVSLCFYPIVQADQKQWVARRESLERIAPVLHLVHVCDSTCLLLSRPPFPSAYISLKSIGSQSLFPAVCLVSHHMSCVSSSYSRKPMHAVRTRPRTSSPPTTQAITHTHFHEATAAQLHSPAIETHPAPAPFSHSCWRLTIGSFFISLEMRETKTHKKRSRTLTALRGSGRRCGLTKKGRDGRSSCAGRAGERVSDKKRAFKRQQAPTRPAKRPRLMLTSGSGFGLGLFRCGRFRC